MYSANPQLGKSSSYIIRSNVWNVFVSKIKFCFDQINFLLKHANKYKHIILDLITIGQGKSKLTDYRSSLIKRLLDLLTAQFLIPIKAWNRCFCSTSICSLTYINDFSYRQSVSTFITLQFKREQFLSPHVVFSLQNSTCLGLLQIPGRKWAFRMHEFDSHWNSYTSICNLEISSWKISTVLTCLMSKKPLLGLLLHDSEQHFKRFRIHILTLCFFTVQIQNIKFDKLW